MSKYADEGSIAHALAAMCLKDGTDCAAYVGRIIECEDYEHSKLGPSNAHRWTICLGSVALEKAVPFTPRKYSMEVTEDMAEDVQVYVDNIRRYADGGHVMLVEKRVDLSEYLGEGQGGTGDVFIIVGDELQAHDLKFGRGVDVSPVKNKQTMLYGLGALPLAELLADIKRFRAVIHQPRITRAPKEWDCSVEELRAFADVAKKAAAGVNYVLSLPIKDVDAYLVTGDHCTFCKASARCPKIAREVSQHVYDAFEVLGNPHETAQPKVVPREAKLLGAYMSKLDLIESWCTAVRAAVEGELIGGREVPGFKLVQGKRGNRKFTNEDTVANVMKTARMKQDEMYSYKLISPTAAEKLLQKERPKVWAKLQPHIGQAEGKPHVAPVSDPRPALPTVIDKFDVAPTGADLV